MRSRYSAYVLKRTAYLLDTWHPDTRPATLDLVEDNTRWIGLEIKHHADTSADHAVVEFVARYKVGGRAYRMHETSQFVRVGGRWLYLDGNLQE